MVYTNKCKQGDLPKFSSVAEAKSYVIENNICEGVKGKALQVLGIYNHPTSNYTITAIIKQYNCKAEELVASSSSNEVKCAV